MKRISISKNTALVISFFFITICLIASFFVSVDFPANKLDLLFYKLSGILLFTTLEASILVEMNLFGIRKKVPFIKKPGKLNHFLFWLITILLAFGLFSIFYNMTSTNFKDQLNTDVDAPYSGNISDQTKAEASAEEKNDVPAPHSGNSSDQSESEAITEEIKEDDPSKSDASVEQSVYSTLSDEQFIFLTAALSKSFYSFTLSEDDYQQLANESTVMDCLTQIYNYAYDHCFELDPDYKEAFSSRYHLVENHPCYELLNRNFLIDVSRNSKAGEWECTINSYSLSPQDVITNNETLYIDAEGYLNKGVVLYWEEDGEIVKVGRVVDIAYNANVDGMVCGYAVNVEFYDDPASSGWMDGEILLAMNKKFTGKPIYYIDPLDANRSIKKEAIDYSTSITWKPLLESNAKSGTDVFLGSNLTGSKSFLFTIVSIDEANDIMTVLYPSGSIENKSFSSLLSKGTLYIR